MKILELIKSKVAQGKSSKMVNNLIALVIVCVIALIAYTVFMPTQKETADDNSDAVSTEQEVINQNVSYTEDMETRLETILSKINGVGKVEVLITYDTSTEIVPAFNVTESKQTTEEEDKQGGVRTINVENTTSNLVTVSEQSQNGPVVIKEIKPLIRGVIVVAEGAENPVVRADLIDAVTTIFQIKSHKVKVYSTK